MNERIKELSDEAYLIAKAQHSVHSPDLLRTYTEKFTELIVRECATLAYDGPSGILDHFGVK